MSWPVWLRWLLWPLELLYRFYMRARADAYRRGWLRARRLPAKVISIGNLTVGGTGKTPMVMRLASWLAQRGSSVAILTRGYGRREVRPMVINGQASGTNYKAEVMGDEPVLLARRLPGVAIGIGADRFALGQRIVQASPQPPVFLLDDGYQHLRLARDLDVLLVDSTDPFGGNVVLPAGRLREPLAALKRATLVVLTRSSGAPAAELRETIRRYNPQAPLFAVSTKFAGVFEAVTDRPADLPLLKQQPVLGFCGIGNAPAFWEDLRRWGFELAGTLAFPDHHRYSIDDFKLITRQADQVRARALLTTEKDAVNFTVVPPSHPPCFYCRIDLEFDDEAGFFAALAERLDTGTARGGESDG